MPHVGAITGWALALGAFTASSQVLMALAAFTLGGVLWAPFIPVVYTLVQGDVTPDEQQPVLTIWTAVLHAAAPLGLALGGPLVTADRSGIEKRRQRAAPSMTGMDITPGRCDPRRQE